MISSQFPRSAGLWADFVHVSPCLASITFCAIIATCFLLASRFIHSPALSQRVEVAAFRGFNYESKDLFVTCGFLMLDFGGSGPRPGAKPNTRTSSGSADTLCR